MASDRTFMQFRSFGYLRIRLLLVKQREIEKLEADLEALDHSELSVTAPENNIDLSANSGTSTGSGDGHAGDIAPGCMRKEEILDALENKIKEYGTSKTRLCAGTTLITRRRTSVEDERYCRIPNSIVGRLAGCQTVDLAPRLDL